MYENYTDQTPPHLTLASPLASTNKFKLSRTEINIKIMKHSRTEFKLSRT